MTYMPTAPVTNMSTVEVYRASASYTYIAGYNPTILLNPVPLNYKVRMMRTFVKICAGYQSASPDRGGCLITMSGQFEANAWLGLPSPSWQYNTYGAGYLTKDKHPYCVSNGGHQGGTNVATMQFQCDISAGGQPGNKNLVRTNVNQPGFEINWYTTSFPEFSGYGNGRTYNGYITVIETGYYHHLSHVSVLSLIYRVP